MTQQINPPANPYDGTGQRPDPDDRHSGAEDLEGTTPVLRSTEAQRLNRKALLFLAGIVALLLMMTVWMVRSATSGGDEVARPREETVVIPELPQAPRQAPALPPAPPAAELIALAAEQPLPPLPPPSARRQPALPALPAAAVPSLMERRTMGAGTQAAEHAGPGQAEYLKAMLAAATGGQAKSEAPKDPATSARFIQAPDALLVRGTYIRCVLDTRIITDIPGFTSCVVTEPVYSINGQRLLLPRGSKVSGRYGSGEPVGPRVSVVWDRITTPNGIDVSMASPGVDNLGGAGHPGDYDAHWPSRIGSALLISLIGDGFKIAAAEHGPPTTTIAQGVVVQEPYESATAHTMERLANEALRKNMSRPATVTIDPGEIINIYVARDVDFSAVVGR